MGSNLDCFRIKKMFESAGREWFSCWQNGEQRSYKFGPAGILDPELVFRGNGNYEIYGNGNHENYGTMRVSGPVPRIYVRASPKATDCFFPEIPKWENVEITFYAKTTDAGSVVSYGGLCACVRTNHIPETILCSTRGYAAKLTFDGKAHFEKECVHNGGHKKVGIVYPFGDKSGMPLNTWIGFKFVCRSTDGGTKCKMELFLDLTNGVCGGDWVKTTEFTDYDGWSSDQVSCCEEHRGKVLNPPSMDKNYSVYLRSDGLGEQFYKWFSVREIYPLD